MKSNGYFFDLWLVLFITHEMWNGYFYFMNSDFHSSQKPWFSKMHCFIFHEAWSVRIFGKHDLHCIPCMSNNYLRFSLNVWGFSESVIKLFHFQWVIALTSFRLKNFLVKLIVVRRVRLDDAGCKPFTHESCRVMNCPSNFTVLPKFGFCSVGNACKLLGAVICSVFTSAWF